MFLLRILILSLLTFVANACPIEQYNCIIASIEKLPPSHAYPKHRTRTLLDYYARIKTGKHAPLPNMPLADYQQRRHIKDLALDLQDQAIAALLLKHSNTTLAYKTLLLTAFQGGFESATLKEPGNTQTNSPKLTAFQTLSESLLTQSENYFSNANNPTDKHIQDITYALVSLYSENYQNELKQIAALELIVDQILVHIVVGSQRTQTPTYVFTGKLHIQQALKLLNDSEMLSLDEKYFLYFYLLELLSFNPADS